MSITKNDLTDIADLARLRIDDAELDEVSTRITSILDLVDQMQAVDTEGVTPLANPLDAAQRLRADEVTETDNRQQFLEIAPATEDGLYLVPRVVE